MLAPVLKLQGSTLCRHRSGLRPGHV